jgi:hypothetical protein
MLRRKFNWWTLFGVGLLGAIMLSTLIREPIVAQQPLENPPEGQTYVGTRECAACHFEEFMAWRNSPHSKAFDILPEKYRADSDCLKCHSTGHGEASGFTTMEATPNLAGTSCEACHGPGSKHTEVAKSFGQEPLTEEQQAYVRSTIHRMQPGNVCVDCHLTAIHKPHPEFDK